MSFLTTVLATTPTVAAQRQGEKRVVLRVLWYQLLSTAKSVGILKHNICNSFASVAENPEPVQACTLFSH